MFSAMGFENMILIISTIVVAVLRVVVGNDSAIGRAMRAKESN